MPRSTSLLLLVTFPALAVETVKLDGRTFTVPDGMTIERVAGPPLVDRPITIAFDPQGRLYAADSSGSIAKAADQLKERPHRIVRLEDSDGDGVYDRQTVFADKMMFPEGTLFHGGSLYVAAPPSIWKLTDTDNDGVADKREEWFDGKTLTNCANDLHGPYLGHDGMLYWTKGAFAKQTYTVNGKDFTTRAAHIFRAPPDTGSGTSVPLRPEPVLTGGMDNPVDVAFLPSGERILSATFLQHPAAGKRDGLVHAVYSGVYGKVHDVLDGHPRTSPDVLPVLSHLGPAASCGLHCYESAALGKQYTGNLFSCAFNLRKVFRHVLTPAGATFTSKDEDFVTCDDADFHPTDVIEDADGSLLIVDTGGWYKLCCPTSRLHRPAALGAVYRVKRKDAPRVEDAWGLKIEWDRLTSGQLAKLLDDERVMVRKRAIETIAAVGCSSSPSVRPPSPKAGQPAPVPADANPAVGEGGGEGRAANRADGVSFALRAVDAGLKAESARVRLAAVWAACRIGGPEFRTSIRIALADKDETVRVAACHAVGLWRDWIAHEDLAKLLAHPSAAVKRAAAEAAGRLGRRESVSELLNAGEREFKAGRRDAVLEHALTYALYELMVTSDPARPTVLAATREGPYWLGAILATDAADAWPDRRESAAWLDRIVREWSKPYQLDAVVWMLARRPGWGPEPSVRGVFGQYVLGMATDLEGRESIPDDERRLTRDRVRRLLGHRTGESVVVGFLQSDTRRRLRLEILSAVTEGRTAKSLDWVAALVQCVGDKDREVSAAAIAALRKAMPDGGSPEAVDLLRELAGNPSRVVETRLGAMAALPATAGRGAVKD
ncbi:MAG TPA: PVC-type heme-binding CxxCH protein, partial [Tepidisphaeraceae bacterium]|nr:PVC-type heme-binding CxxCH protein [Tepidisphaeraceae bacterium]